MPGLSPLSSSKSKVLRRGQCGLVWTGLGEAFPSWTNQPGAHLSTLKLEVQLPFTAWCRDCTGPGTLANPQARDCGYCSASQVPVGSDCPYFYRGGLSCPEPPFISSHWLTRAAQSCRCCDCGQLYRFHLIVLHELHLSLWPLSRCRKFWSGRYKTAMYGPGYEPFSPRVGTGHLGAGQEKHLTRREA